MIRRPPRSTRVRSSAASDVYKRQLEDDAGAARVSREPGHLRDDARTSGVGAVQPVELVDELGVDNRLAVRGLELVERRDQRLGDEPPAEVAEVRAFLMLERPSHPRGTVRVAWLTGHGRTARSAGCEPAATRSASAARGLPPVTSASPTSTASAPAFAYSTTSCGSRTPDSAIRAIPPGMRCAKRANKVRSTSKVRRSRALTPMMRAPASAARAISSASCTSTRAVIPREWTRSTKEVSTVCSSAATIRSTMSAPCARASHTSVSYTHLRAH